MSNVYAVVMAGGRGERFWPLSTHSVPKPFIPLLGPRTLIQQTVDRLQALLPPERILLSIGETHRNLAETQLPQIPGENFLVEPVGRDTAACLGYCALFIERRDPDAVMLAIPADHYIADGDAYRRTLETGVRALPGSAGVVFGIRPIRAETGYGYIQVESARSTGDALPVIRFVEKPDAARASEYLRSENFFWNSGIFLWRNRTLLDLIQQHMPELDCGLQALRPLIDKGKAQEEIKRIFSALPRISIDFGIAERIRGLRLVPAGFTWDDIGSWGALERALPADAAGNVSIGKLVALESNGCVAYSDAGTIATFGVSNLIVVQAHGRVLVCSKDRAADLKRLVAALGDPH